MFSKKSCGAGTTRRTALAVLFGAAMAAVGCANGAGTATSPSGVAPSSLASAPSNDRYFDVTIAETSIPVGASELTVTITNLNSGSSQKLGSVQIYVPAGLTPVSVDTFSPSTWSGVITGQTVEVGGPGSAKLQDGQSVTFKLHVTSTTCATYTFVTSQGSNAALADAFVNEWTAPRTVLSVAVTGCSVTCDAAPAVANAYLDSIEFAGGRGAIDSAVAHHMTQGALFDGISPCDTTAYRNAVIAFVQALLAATT